MTRLSEIEKRLAAATPGPWLSAAGTVWSGEYADGGDPDLLVRVGSYKISDDARFIAHSWADIRDLLAVAKASARMQTALDVALSNADDLPYVPLTQAYRGVADALDALEKGPTDG